MNNEQLSIAVIGGGAAGFFGAIAAADHSSRPKVVIFEKHKQVLAKVRISGGGRCNVTHACFDPAELIKFYPRGGHALRGPFSRFQPRDTIQWFEERNVTLKAEPDGRMFPITDSSETIIHCLQQAARKHLVEVRTECGVISIHKKEDQFHIELTTGEKEIFDKVLIATGSTPKTYSWLEPWGHTVEPLVPSLFTFNSPDSPFKELAGIAVPKAEVKIAGTSLKQMGPVLITHWGFSGPAILKLSAWGARVLHDQGYNALAHINWIPEFSYEDVKSRIQTERKNFPARQISGEPLFQLPRNLWKQFVQQCSIPMTLRWSEMSNVHMEKLNQCLHATEIKINGKTTYKEEFVTCGGVNLKEVNFQTMESKLCPGIFFAGEILDIDGITGGFNFQNAWTTSWIVGKSMVL